PWTPEKIGDSEALNCGGFAAKTGTGSERLAGIPEEFTWSRGACPPFWGKADCGIAEGSSPPPAGIARKATNRTPTAIRPMSAARGFSRGAPGVMMMMRRRRRTVFRSFMLRDPLTRLRPLGTHATCRLCFSARPRLVLQVVRHLI